jgi:hypothetical protein
MQVRKNQTNFSRGEVSETLDMRADTKVYGDGASLLLNMRLLAHGGASRRPGLRFLQDLGASAASRLEPFVFSEDQSYVIVFQASTYRVYSTAGSLLWTEGAAPWTGPMLPELGVAQTGDVMIVCHPSMAPQMIRRTAFSTFTLEPVAFGSRAGGSPPALRPFHRFAASGVTLTPSALAGAVTLTSSAPLWLPGHVGTIVRYAGTEAEVTGITSTTVASATARETLAGTWQQKVEILVGDLVQSSRSTAKAVVVDLVTVGADKFIRYVMLGRAQPFEWDAAIESFVFSATLRTEVLGDATVHATPYPLADWDEQAFSAVRGWPGAVAFHEGRLILGGSTSLPNWIFLSDVGSFFTFSLDLAADDGAISGEITTDQVSRLRHIVSQRHLQLYCDTAELYIPQGPEKPLTPETFSIRAQTRIGSSHVRPRPFDGTTLFCQRTGRAIREFTYNDSSLSYDAVIASVMSPHLIRGPVDMDVQLGSQATQEQYAYVVMDDGTMAVLHSNRAEEVAGWTPWVTDGLFKSVRTVNDQVFVLVERGARLYLETFDLTLSVDSGVTFPASTLTHLLPHLPGRAVVAVKGLEYYGLVTTDGAGLATYPYQVPKDVGLGYECRIRTLPSQVDVGQGRRTGQPVRVSKATVWIVESVTFRISGATLQVRSVTDDMSLPPSPKSGPYELRLLGWDRLGQVTIDHFLPLPLTVLGLSLEVNS